LSEGRWEEVDKLFPKMRNEFLTHFDMEESVAFKEFNAAECAGCNPTGVMVAEHEQMRLLLNRAEQYIDSRDKDTLLSLFDSFMLVVQQHNIKEENIMYSLLDQALNANREKIIEDMKSKRG